ncbi:MAG: DUF2069 domain-containing protein [Panacagrimonas sp.]
MMPSTLAQRIVLVTHALLIVLVALRNPSVLSVLLAGILCLPVLGLVRGRPYTYAWASMLIAFYVAGYLADGYARPSLRWSAFGVASVAALEYISLMMFVRFRAREARMAQAPAARTAGSDDASR